MLIYIAHKFENNPENVEIVKNMLHELNLSDVENTYVSPVTLFGDLYDLMSYDDGMKKCFTLLAKCDAIVFTGDWETSTGCKLEFTYASNKPFIYMLTKHNLKNYTVRNFFSPLFQDKEFISKYF